jgi:hypothetical protein
MIKKNNKYLGAALATLTVASLIAAPQVMAKKAKSSAHSAAALANSKADMMEAQLRAMQDEIANLRAQVNASASAKTVDADTQKVQELDAWMADVKSKPAEKKSKDNMLYFRGGYSGNDESMAATTNTVNVNGSPVTYAQNGGTGGWNFGAGIDFSLDDNLYGLMDKTELLGELDLNYVDLGTFTSSFGTNGATVSTATQSMLRISASPKIKFMKGSKFRPWVIPVGFTLNVISPPSQAGTITELKPAMNFGTGMDYNIWKSLYVGADVRYFLATTSLDGTNVNGLTAGGSLGFGF